MLRLNNRLLDALSPESRGLLLPRLTAVPMPVGLGIYEPDKAPAYCYFMTSGMASVVTSMKDGTTAEVGVIGCDGVVGGLHLMGPGKISTNSFVQIEGTALRIPFAHLRQVYRSCEEIRDRILEFVQEQSANSNQLAACNQLHQAEERLARWLLTAQDRTQSDVLRLTQEFLALMLGSRRTTVTIVAGTLQRAGLIQYERGLVRILDRAGLEAAACDCYQVIKRLHSDLFRHPWSAAPEGHLPSNAKPVCLSN